MERLWFGILFAGLIGIASSAIAEDTHVALIKSVQGSVKVLRQQETFDAKAGTTLEIADGLTSANGASAAIVFRDGTLLTLGSGAELKVRDYVFEPKDSKYAFSVFLNKGTAIYESGKIGKLSPDAVVIDTPTATVGVRGTRFLVEAK
jgi:hypothetical protein